MSCLSARVHTPKYLPFQFLLCPPLGYPRILSISYSTHSSSMALTTHLLFLWFPSLSLPTTTSILNSNPMYSNRNWILQNFLVKILYKNLPGISSITSGPLKDFILPYLLPKLETSISNFTYFSTSPKIASHQIQDIPFQKLLNSMHLFHSHSIHAYISGVLFTFFQTLILNAKSLYLIESLHKSYALTPFYRQN